MCAYCGHTQFLLTYVLNVCRPLEVVVGCSMVDPVHAIDGPLRLSELREVANLHLFFFWDGRRS